MSTTAVLEAPGPAATAAVPELADLILLRLLPAAKSVGVADLRKDLATICGHALGAGEVNDALAGLKAEGFLAGGRGNRLSDAGRARALQNLGVEKLPPRANWSSIKSKYLVPRALDIPSDSPEYAGATNGDKLAAFLLKRALGLPRAGGTVAAVVDALLCRELGHPAFTSLNALVRSTLGKALGGSPISKRDAKAVLPKVKLNVRSVRKEQLLGAVLGGGLTPLGTRSQPVPAQPEQTQPAEPEPFDLEAFANTVKSVARTCPTKEFGDNKAFISHVWERLRNDRPFATLGLDGFKAKLVEANRERLLTLSRADLVQFMDPADVQASEIRYLTAAFHFILIEGN